MLISKTNSKLEKTSKLNKAKIYQFNLPAYKTKAGKTVCPFAKDCVKFCYAQKGTFRFSNVQKKYESNYKITKQSNFVKLIQDDLNRAKPTHLRIHSSGDFYGLEYLKKWVKIAINNPEITFYGYTKSIPIFKKLNSIPDNFIFCYSEGGKMDHLIDTDKDYHARIFNSKKELEKAGYIDTSENDLWITQNNNKIGLIYH